MLSRIRLSAGVLLITAIMTCAWPLEPAAGSDDPWHHLARLISSTDRPESTAVLVLFDQDVVDTLRRRLPQAIQVVAFSDPSAPRDSMFVPARLGLMYRKASAAVSDWPSVWVVGRHSGSKDKERALRFGQETAALLRRRALLDSLKTGQGTVEFSRWVDVPGGTAQREAMRRGRAQADSILAAGIPKLAPITKSFARRDLAIDRDTLSFYVAKLSDTTFYAVGGCSEVETIFWYAPERLSGLGPGVVPDLVGRIADPNPFVRERVQYALLLATQDERVMARTGGDYLKFYNQPGRSPSDIVEVWWKEFGHFWASADSSH